MLLRGSYFDFFSKPTQTFYSRTRSAVFLREYRKWSTYPLLVTGPDLPLFLSARVSEKRENRMGYRRGGYVNCKVPRDNFSDKSVWTISVLPFRTMKNTRFKQFSQGNYIKRKKNFVREPFPVFFSKIGLLLFADTTAGVFEVDFDEGGGKLLILIW